MTKSKAFTFLELLIVVVLVLSVYGLFFTKFDFNKKESSVKLENLKSYLLTNFSFDENLKLICIEEEYDCFVFVDNKVSKENKIEGLFKSKPEVYKYDASLDSLSFNSVDFGDLDEYDVFFEFNINKDRKSDDVVVDMGEKVYIFTAIKNNPLILKDLGDVSDLFEQRISEVKNAF